MNRLIRHTALQALFMTLAAFPAAARPRSGSVRRPVTLVYAAPRGRTAQIDVYAAGVRRRWIRRLTRDKAAETALQCVAGGKHVVYVADGKVYSVAVRSPKTRRRGRRRRRRRAGRKPAPPARVAPVLLGTLPQDLWQQHYTRIRHFIRPSPTGRYVTIPQKGGILLSEITTGRSKLIRPAACATAPAPAPAAAAAVPVRVVHPAYWMPGKEAFVYLAIKGASGPGEVQARVYEVGTGTQRSCWQPLKGRPQQPAPKLEAVEAWEALWSHDGKTLAISARGKAARRNKLYHRVFGLGPITPIRLPSGLRTFRIHGWRADPVALVLTGKVGRRTRLWTAALRPVTTRRRRKVRTRRLWSLATLGRTWGVLSYHDGRRTALIATPGRGACAKTRLLKVVKGGGPRSLIRWAKWSELLAADPSGTWGLFRAAVRCHHPRPALYLMRVDGTGLTRSLPGRFRPLRTVHPGQVALCPRS